MHIERKKASFLALKFGLLQGLILSSVNFIAAPILISNTYEEILGLYGIISQVIGYAVILEFGASSAVIQRVSSLQNKNKYTINKILKSGGVLLGAHNLLVFFAYLALAFFPEILIENEDKISEYEIRKVFAFFAIFALLRWRLYIYQFALIGMKFGYVVNIINIITSFIKIVCIVFLVNGSNAFLNMFLIVFVSDIIGYFLSYIYYKIKFKRDINVHDKAIETRKLSYDILKFGFKYWVINTTHLLQTYSDIIVVAKFLGVGFASKLYAIKMLSSFLVSLIVKVIDSIYPSLSEYFSVSKREDSARIVLLSFRIYIYLVVGGISSLFILSPHVNEYLYGMPTKLNIEIVWIAAFTLFVQTISHFFATIVLSISKIDGWSRIALLGFIFSLSVVYIVKGAYGPFVLIFSLNIGLMLQIAYLIYMTRKTFQITYSMLARSLMPSFLYSVSFYFLYSNFLNLNNGIESVKVTETILILLVVAFIFFSILFLTLPKDIINFIRERRS
jgi:O-antigen/teichoic acid export membrane protein